MVTTLGNEHQLGIGSHPSWMVMEKNKRVLYMSMVCKAPEKIVVQELEPHIVTMGLFLLERGYQATHGDVAEKWPCQSPWDGTMLRMEVFDELSMDRN